MISGMKCRRHLPEDEQNARIISITSIVVITFIITFINIIIDIVIKIYF